MAFFFTVDGKFPRNAFACEKRLFGAIDTESDHFAKTGSGQTEGKLRKKGFFGTCGSACRNTGFFNVFSSFPHVCPEPALATILFFGTSSNL
jgi:hypothetical protein